MHHEVTVVRVLFIALIFLAAACSGRGKSSPEQTFSPAETVEEEVTPSEDESPAADSEPKGPPAAETLKAVKFLLAPCTSPLAIDMLEEFKVGADILRMKAEGNKKTISLNGKDLWAVTSYPQSDFAYDMSVNVVGEEAVFPAYLCNRIVTSYPDDASPGKQRHSLAVDADNATAQVTWETRKEGGKDLVYKVEVLLPGASAALVFQ